MAENKANTPTVSIPFIYLKLKSIKDSVPRKITYPRSYNHLLATASRIFKDYITVQSFFNENGVQIESLNDVPPGALLLCSELPNFKDEIEEEEEEEIVNKITPKKKSFDVMSKTSFNRIFGTDFGDDPNQVVFNPVDTTNGKPVNLTDRVPNKSSHLSPRKKKEIPNSVLTAKQERRKEKRQAALKKRLSATPQSRLPEPIPDKTPSPKNESPKKTSPRNSPSKYAEIFLTGRKTTNFNTPRDQQVEPEEDEETKAYKKLYTKKATTEEEIQEVNNASVYELISSLFSTDITPLTDNSKEALMFFENPTRSFISHLPELEDVQKSRWFTKSLQRIFEFGFPEINESLIAYDSMIGIARSVIIDHRFNKKGGSSHRFNIAIVGPKKSGKSTFLSIFVQELLLELATTEKWKEFFIFVLDMEKLIETTDDLSSFYIYMIEATFKQMEHQSPQFEQYFPMIKKHFLSIIELKSPPIFPKPFRESEETHVLANELQQIANQLSNAWNDDSFFNQFVTNTMMFPKMISDIFGFKHYLLVFDNFELCDTFIMPNEPFSSSSENFQFASLMTFMISNNNFIISCKDHKYLTNLLLNVDGVPPIPDYISTLNLCTERAYSKRQFNVVVNHKTIPLTVNNCGGIPSYIKSWISLNEFYDNMCKINTKKDREEANLIFIDQVESFMNILFVDDDNESISVETVSC